MFRCLIISFQLHLDFKSRVFGQVSQRFLQFTLPYLHLHLAWAKVEQLKDFSRVAKICEGGRKLRHSSVQGLKFGCKNTWLGISSRVAKQAVWREILDVSKVDLNRTKFQAMKQSPCTAILLSKIFLSPHFHSVFVICSTCVNSLLWKEQTSTVLRCQNQALWFEILTRRSALQVSYLSFCCHGK